MIIKSKIMHFEKHNNNFSKNYNQAHLEQAIITGRMKSKEEHDFVIEVPVVCNLGYIFFK